MKGSDGVTAGRGGAWRPSRREFLGVGGAVALGGGLAGALAWRRRDESGLRADVFIGEAEDYDADLAGVLRTAFAELGITSNEIRGKSILLKPNLVETAPGQLHINTHPAVVLGAAGAFRSLGAARVTVAEGQGHRRDSWLVLEESGMARMLEDADLPFVDLNHDDCGRVTNRGGATSLEYLYPARSVLAADWVVSVAKLKTHHWAVITCSLKNMFGILPGTVYGWPKNPLHVAGIAESITDINCTIRPSLAIVDGIVGMEGDGPIMGRPKHAGCLIVGRSAAAVDATCARVMGLEPDCIGYLKLASGCLGPIGENHIRQRGARIQEVAASFHIVDAPHLRDLRTSPSL